MGQKTLRCWCIIASMTLWVGCTTDLQESDPKSLDDLLGEPAAATETNDAEDPPVLCDIDELESEDWLSALKELSSSSPIEDEVFEAAKLNCSEGVQWQLEQPDDRLVAILEEELREENTLHGLGFVVGLNGTGDNSPATQRALSLLIGMLDLQSDVGGGVTVNELKNAKSDRSVALVFVKVATPAEGAHHGEALNCVVRAVFAESLKGGYLMKTPLLASRPGNPRIYGWAEGAIVSDDAEPFTVGTINGISLEEERTSFAP